MCDRTPLVEPWISKAAERRRSDRYDDAIVAGTSGVIRTRPLSAAEVEALLGRTPRGYAEGLVVLELTLELSATSPAQLVAEPRVRYGSTAWRSPSYEEHYALFDVTPPPREREEPSRTLLGGALFVLTVGIVDLEDRWGSLGASAPDPSEEMLARRKVASEALSLDVPKNVDPGGSLTQHLLIGREAEASPVDLEVVELVYELRPSPGGCGFIGGRADSSFDVSPTRPETITFGPEDLERPG